jgi:type VI secretion system secreted protein VgrG
MNVGKNETVHIGMDQDIKVGKSITLTCGPSSIQMDPSGITIKAMQITIKGEVAVSVDGVITKVNAGAILKLTGGVTMIN